MSLPPDGGSFSLGSLMSLLMVTLEELTPILDTIQSEITGLDNNLQGAAKDLVGDYNTPGSQVNAGQTNNRNALNFSGLGAQSFAEAITVHIKVTEFFTTAFNSMDAAAKTFLTNISNSCLKYDGQLGNIQPEAYAPQGGWELGDAARAAFFSLNPYPVLVTNVIAAASDDGNEILQSNSSVLSTLLQGAYQQLLARADAMSISIQFTSSDTPSEQPGEVTEARSIVQESLYEMYQAIKPVYTNWSHEVEQEFSTFSSAIKTAEQQLQPAIDLLTNPDSAASIFDLIEMISGSDSPIAITQIGPNRILVTISGTELNNLSYDTNIWNALGTGMGQNMPYEQDVIDAIETYCAEHGLTNPQVVLAGHSLGGMVAQQVADTGMFDVTQVVTYGSPIMGDPVPGVKYDIYEAQGDLVPLLSRYENPLLPSSLSQIAAMFPWAGPPKSASIWTHLKDYLEDADIVLTAPISYGPGVAQVATGLGYLAGTEYIPGLLAPKVGTDTPLNIAAKQLYMDPKGLYTGSLQLVPDLTTANPSVHSDYGKSTWLEGQSIYQNMPTSGFLSNTEYFGMPNMPQTAQIDQYMRTHSSLGELVSHLIKP